VALFGFASVVISQFSKICGFINLKISSYKEASTVDGVPPPIKTVFNFISLSFK
jgi:hypothetical protein